MIPHNSMGSLAQSSAEAQPLGPIEPWMKDFVKGRHSPEEWEAFLVYSQAGRWKRLGLQFAMVFQALWSRS